VDSSGIVAGSIAPRGSPSGGAGQRSLTNWNGSRLVMVTGDRVLQTASATGQALDALDARRAEIGASAQAKGERGDVVDEDDEDNWR
jgi:hypothetical protein